MALFMIKRKIVTITNTPQNILIPLPYLISCDGSAVVSCLFITSKSDVKRAKLGKFKVVLFLKKTLLTLLRMIGEARPKMIKSEITIFIYDLSL